MSWRKITFIIVALIVLLGGSAALSELFVSMKPEPMKKPEQTLKRSVKVEEVVYSDIVSPLTVQGRAVSGSEVVLVAEAAGKIEPGAVRLRKGTKFTKGQLLAVIYKDEAELALKARKSNFLSTMISLLPDIKVDFPEVLETYENFFHNIDLNKNLPALPEVKNEKLKIFLASRGVFNEYYGILQDEKKLSRHSLYAPFDGTFTQINYEVGAYVNTGAQIGRMIRTDNVEIEVPVPNGDSKWIKVGDKVEVYDNDSDGIKQGTVVRKSNFIDEATQSRSIFVEVQSSPADELLTGEYKVVDFPGHKIARSMEIPRNAVFNSNVVYAVVNGQLKKREINILKTMETTLIFNGIEEGTKMVVEPLINVKENTPVNILGEEVVKEGNRKSKSTKEQASL
ncbi:HlyD family efflux transporter periplasmic adaptor subunit [Prolixibacteraceae bacterium Z1-6]|uniref:HlyD family efflux transporter periplasmic adaptor subunit n=1 Tax=Draconibacterium aestuarii TaxID=2998507 RepID=A0A9X3F648_9BACT|nr:HlyD family efflux transporter periplasmic adaptor subunit [Prolixibacteraceae bacterium Z1-6]